MSNLTLVPAFRCKVDTWRYYVCRMKYVEAAREIRFPSELGRNLELSEFIQRGLTARTRGFTEALLQSVHPFLGSLVVAVWGGEPRYTPLSMDDPKGMLDGLEEGLGVLTFDGTRTYFVLDGQHRLRAIKDAIRQKPEIGKEDVCVLIVTHWDTPEGRLRTRRLFSNINRNAKQTGTAENVALDEDDGFAILTRRVLDEHEFLRQEGRVKVIIYAGDEGELKLASGSVPKTDARALTTFTVLYDVLHYLGLELPGAMRARTTRPSDEVLEESYNFLTSRLDDLLKYCGNVRERLETAQSARDVRAPKNAEGEGHPFLRPVVQKAVARVASEIAQQGALPWAEIMQRLSELDWKMASPPWESVFSVDGGKMLVGKENTTLLGDLLHVHLAPRSGQDIKRARKAFKDVRGKQYPVAEEELAKRIPQGEVRPVLAPIVLPAEISTDAEPEPTTASDTQPTSSSAGSNPPATAPESP